MIVEFLTFDVDPIEREQWLRTEEQNWSRFLERQDGFVSKQIWQSADNETRIHAVIWWETLEKWKAIPQEALDEVIKAMGPHEKEATMTVYHMLRDC
ncbi:MAG: TIGR03792 family protein [Acidimicrobiia bacterium]|nr:TIGR03792 family protein [Acidimicrobiia bacterium]